MPIYEYQCKNCGHRFEQLQKIGEPPLQVCSACHHQTLIKLISSVGFQLKGTGWYVTDFKQAPQQKPQATTDTSEAARSKETKPATTSSTTEAKT